jgi:hypothetical protein
VSGLQKPTQLVAAAIRPARGNARELALFCRIYKSGTGKEHSARRPRRSGQTDVDGPDFTLTTQKDETECHRRGSIAEPSRLGAQDA